MKRFNQITVRGLDDELSARLRRLAKREGISLNQAALRLLRRGAGLAEGADRADTVGSSFDRLIGSWTQADADEMEAALEDFETVDESGLEMRVLLDSNAYSLLMRGHEEVAGLVRRAEEVLFSAVVVGELMYGFGRGSHFERKRGRPAHISREPLLVVRRGGTGHRGPLRQDSGCIEGEGAADSDERRVDSGPRDGDRRGSGLGVWSFRAG